MRKNFLRSTIRPTLDLDTITINLRSDAAVPTIEMRGRVLTSNARARAVTEAMLKTAHLTAKGAEFIEEIKALFDAQIPESDKERK